MGIINGSFHKCRTPACKLGLHSTAFRTGPENKSKFKTNHNLKAFYLSRDEGGPDFPENPDGHRGVHLLLHFYFLQHESDSQKQTGSSRSVAEILS